MFYDGEVPALARALVHLEVEARAGHELRTGAAVAHPSKFTVDAGGAEQLTHAVPRRLVGEPLHKANRAHAFNWTLVPACSSEYRVHHLAPEVHHVVGAHLFFLHVAVDDGVWRSRRCPSIGSWGLGRCQPIGSRGLGRLLPKRPELLHVVVLAHLDVDCFLAVAGSTDSTVAGLLERRAEPLSAHLAVARADLPS